MALILFLFVLFAPLIVASLLSRAFYRWALEVAGQLGRTCRFGTDWRRGRIQRQLLVGPRYGMERPTWADLFAIWGIEALGLVVFFGLGASGFLVLFLGSDQGVWP